MTINSTVVKFQLVFYILCHQSVHHVYKQLQMLESD